MGANNYVETHILESSNFNTTPKPNFFLFSGFFFWGGTLDTYANKHLQLFWGDIRLILHTLSLWFKQQDLPLNLTSVTPT